MALRMTEEEYREFQRRGTLKPSGSGCGSGPKRSKYGNRKVEINGMKFDSKHEAEEYLKLDARRRAGELGVILRQVPFDLPGGIRYYADFVAIDREMRVEGVYDAKSEITRKNRVYINKKKQMKALMGIEIREV